MAITLTDRERRCIALFEAETGATVRDCVVDDEEDRVVFVVAAGQMREAIGPDGRTVRGVESRLGRDVELVESAETPAAFVANALSPAAVTGVTIEDGVAVASVPEPDRGAAIGADGRNVRMARRLAARHFDVEDVRIAD